MQFPDDENGDVLRRMHASGFDFGQPHDVDFFALFAKNEDATVVAKQFIADHETGDPLVSVKTASHDSGRTELAIVKSMLVTHENVTAFENLLADRCASFDGKLDGWGVMQDPQEDRTSPPDNALLTEQPEEMRSRLDYPDDHFDAAELAFVDGIKQHGWMHTNALDEDDKPGFSFTTGFAASIGHPELIIFKVDKKVAHDIFWLLYRCAENGKPVPRARRVGGILPNDDAYIFTVARRHYPNYLGWSRWFYRGDDFECLQVVWPDEAGVFPWEDGFDPKYANAQVDLSERGWAAEVAG